MNRYTFKAKRKLLLPFYIIKHAIVFGPRFTMMRIKNYYKNKFDKEED